jgi:hypothetical protein
VDKGGADVLQFPQRTVAAAGGSAVVFSSLEGFAGVQGSGLAFDYVARRAPNGTWETHGITPKQQPEDIGIYLFGGFDTHYLLFSEDLSHGVFLARSPLTDAPNVASAINLYARDDVLQPGDGSYSLLTNAASPLAPSFEIPYVADASADLSHVIFESSRNLTPDAASLDPSQPKLYEWVDGSVRLAGILPADEGGGPTVSQAGQGFAHGSPLVPVRGTISRDGRRVFFTAPPFSGDGLDGALYVRDDQGTATVGDDQTVRVSASERTDCAGDPTCGGDGIPDPAPDPSNPGGVPPPAKFSAASNDGSKVFFTTTERLTDDDGNGANDVYRFDLDAPVGHRLTRLSVDSEPSDDATQYEVSGVLGASTDGSYVYFTVNQGQLVAGNPTGDTGGPVGNARIFVWHAGTVHEVGAVNITTELFNMYGQGTLAFQKDSSVTPDGKHLVFLTEGTQELLSLYGKPEYDHGLNCPSITPACSEVYVYDATADGGAGDLQCASCNPTGQPASSDASFDAGKLERGGAHGTAYQPRVVTDDGRFVFFDSYEQLVAEDENTAADTYEFDTATGRVHLISSGRGSGNQLFMDASADGRDVFFTSREQLSPTDRDQGRDLYDARIGGVPGSPPKTVVPCDGDGCRGAAVPLPSFTEPESLIFDSLGNLKPDVSKKKAPEPASKAQKLKKALKACKSKHKKSQRKKCESATHRRFGKSGGSK